MVRNTHGRICRVHMLATGPGTAIGIDANIGWVDLNLDIVIHNRVDPHRAKRRVPFGGGVKWADPDQAMHARL